LVGTHFQRIIAPSIPPEIPAGEGAFDATRPLSPLPDRRRRGITLTLAMAAAAQAPQASVRPKVVLQMSEADPGRNGVSRSTMRRTSRRNLGAANVDVELVAYGPASGC
jgi:hypothetical protein